MNFTIITTSELIDCIKNFQWSRTIAQLHVHHTWKPEHADYNGTNGIALQAAIRDYHIHTNGWQDIGQHLTLLPDGQWVTGRNFNADPASIAGWNTGAFAIEMLGNFDAGHDRFDGRQAQAMFEFCTFFVEHMKLDIKSDVKFHRDSPTAGKTCPGSSIDREWFINELDREIKALKLPSGNKEPWKYKAIDDLASAGLVNDPQGWKSKIDDPIPVWAAFALLDRIYQKLKGN